MVFNCHIVMKNCFLFIVLFCSFQAAAQVFNPGSVIKRKSEDRVNQRVDQSIDKALDKLFAPGEKKNKETGAEGGNPLGGLQLGGKPADAYAFQASMIVQMKMTSSKETQSWRMKYLFDQETRWMGMKFLEGNDPNMAQAYQMMDAVVFDFNQMKIFSFVNNNGTKMAMGLGFKPDKLETQLESQPEKYTLTKTSETKSIGGQACQGWKMSDEKGKETVMLWVSTSPVGDFSRFAKAMARSGGNLAKGKSPNMMAYQSHPELLKMASQGRMILGMSSQGDKGEQMDMEFLDFKANDPVTFRTAGYQSMF